MLIRDLKFSQQRQFNVPEKTRAAPVFQKPPEGHGDVATLEKTQLIAKDFSELRIHFWPDRNTIGVQSTSPGTDGITVRMLKACWQHVSLFIQQLYNCCLRLCHFPRAWKLAEVAMIPKVGKRDRSSVRSWRPIALLSVISKGLERIIARRLAYTALIHGIVSPQHGGALPRRSAMDLVAAFTHEVEAAFAQNKEVSMVTMDVQGAFDAVLRRRLLQRMAQQGWPRELLQLIDSFLTERRAQVRLEGTTTAAHQMQCGTPQGSPLSPILFLLYLAELLWQNSELRFGYADDLNIWRATHSLDNNATLLRQDIQSILRWGEINKVAFAPEKLEMIHLTRKRHNEAPAVVVSEDLTVHPVTAPAGQEPALRWLGVHFDRRLTWRPHVSTRAKKARAVAQHIRSLGKTRDGPPADALRKAVTTCVVPSLLYGTEAWYGGRTQPTRCGCAAARLDTYLYELSVFPICKGCIKQAVNLVSHPVTLSLVQSFRL
ncbi:conserved hypothetical protein [Histoplasma mississippiense (nom. inval.)]|uniref:conserved hypothetical protein n=1 Tax=Ajellomyces capsulatus (strain NAm1 / WU24) TaxID=2059318 RepID=UPI000157C0AD|nr:conserved hypothetical protein [Histoplasma mississippiense (nom. inval.)]EDN07103.1 conserved hypothetical protein [Histoplasma mississippiense (nom. inval.)]